MHRVEDLTVLDRPVGPEPATRVLELLGLVERQRLAARLLVDPSGAAEARATLAEVYAGFDEGHGARDLRDAAAVLERTAQVITPETASASTSIPSATR